MPRTWTSNAQKTGPTTLSTFTVLLIAAVLALAVLSPSPASAATTATLSGTVRSAGAGVAGVCFGVQADGSVDPVAAGTTDGSGAWSAEVPAGTYVVQFDDCTDRGLVGTFYGGDDQAGATRLTVAAGQAVTGLDVSLVPGATIAGTVRAPGGGAPSLECATAYTGRPTVGETTWRSFGATADENGSYRITGLPAGSYTVLFSGCGIGQYANGFYTGNAASDAAGGTDDPAAAQLITLAGGARRDAVDLTVAAGSTVAGSVRTAAGDPAGLACVKAIKEGGNEANPAYAAATIAPGGTTYRLAGLRAARYTVKVEPCGGGGLVTTYYQSAATLAGASYVATVAGETRSGVDVVMRDANSPRPASAPTNVTWSNDGPAGRVDVSWSEPSDKGSGGTITDYVVTTVPSSGDPVVTTSRNAALTLPPGVAHQVYVTARTSAGYGTSSDPVTVTSRAGTRLTVQVDPSTGVSGQSTTVTGTVAVADGAGDITPSGVVGLLVDDTPAGSASVRSDGTFTGTAVLRAGAHQIGALYSGDADTAGASADPVAVTRDRATTSVTVTGPPGGTVAAGAAVPLQVSAAVVAPGNAAALDAEAVVSEGGTELGRATIALGSGPASGGPTFEIPGLAAGAHRLDVTVAGTAETKPGTGNVTVTVSGSGGGGGGGGGGTAVAPSFTAASPPAQVATGTPVSYSFAATGTPAPTFSLASGTLPTGLTLTGDGLLSGTATSAGEHTFRVKAANTAGSVTTGDLTITVEGGVDVVPYGSRTVHRSATARSIASPAVVAGPGAVLVATVSVAGDGHRVSSMRGSGLHWTRVARTRTARGTTEVWRTRVPSDAATGTRATATATFRVSGSRTRLFATLTAVTGAGGVVALGDDHAASGRPRVRVSGTAGALVFLQGRVANDVRVRPSPGQQLVGKSRQRSQTAWFQRLVLPSAGNAAAGVQDRYRAPWDVVAFAVTRAAGAPTGRPY